MSERVDRGERVELEVAGMTCTACGQHVAAALQALGADEVVVDWRAGLARFTPAA